MQFSKAVLAVSVAEALRPADLITLQVIWISWDVLNRKPNRGSIVKMFVAKMVTGIRYVELKHLLSDKWTAFGNKIIKGLIDCRVL